MRSSITVLGAVAASALAACATQPSSSYPATTEARLATYAKATPCCDDPSGFSYGALPRQGHAQAVVDDESPVFDFQSGLSPFVAFELPDQTSRYRIRVKSVFDGKDGAEEACSIPSSRCSTTPSSSCT